jgi:hypothetical protein
MYVLETFAFGFRPNQFILQEHRASLMPIILQGGKKKQLGFIRMKYIYSYGPVFRQKNKSPSHDLVLSLLAHRIAKIWPGTCEEETCDRRAKDAREETRDGYRNRYSVPRRRIGRKVAIVLR